MGGGLSGYVRKIILRASVSDIEFYDNSSISDFYFLIFDMNFNANRAKSHRNIS